MLEITEINDAIDREINYIGFKNPESVKGMLRIRTILNQLVENKHRKQEVVE
jgi:hypothetical protein